MSLSKPYFRIFRPGKGTEFSHDLRYASDRTSMINSYHLLEKDLMAIFEFIEPVDQNLNTYSHRLYELFLRAATEFETNAAQILISNKYKTNNYNISDYYLINKACKLSEYSITLSNWSTSKILTPFEDWKVGSQLKWYSEYNKVKHDRSKNFKNASLGNVLNATAGVLGILVAQFDLEVQSPMTSYNLLSIGGDDSGYSEPISINSIFRVQRPKSWTEDEKYDFNWDNLKITSEPFQKYSF